MKQTMGSSDEGLNTSMNGKMANAAMGQNASQSQTGSSSSSSSSMSSPASQPKKTQTRQAPNAKNETSSEQKNTSSDQDKNAGQSGNQGTEVSKAASRGTSDASHNQSQKGGPLSAFTANLPDESRENIERFISSGKDFLTEGRTYLKQYPGEAAGLLACAGAVAWALFATKPGRHLIEVGSPVASKWLADNLSSTFRGSEPLQ